MRALKVGIEVYGEVFLSGIDIIIILSVDFGVEREARHARDAGAHSDELSDGGGKFHTYTSGGHVGVDCKVVKQILRCGCSGISSANAAKIVKTVFFILSNVLNKGDKKMLLALLIIIGGKVS